MIENKGPLTLHSRYGDGMVEVKVVEEGCYIIGGEKVVGSVGDLLRVLTGHPFGRHWGFARYFKLGKYAPKGGRPEEFPILEFVGDSGVRDGLGIDLQKRGKEVAKLLYAGFGNWIRGNGYDPRDVLQEVYKGILIRNKGRCPFDSGKSTFGHYVHLVCGCVLANYHKKQQRLRGQEGNRVWTDSESWDKLVEGRCDDSASNGLVEGVLAKLSVAIGDGEVADIARRMLPLVVAGYTQKEVRDELGVGAVVVREALELLKSVAKTTLCI